MSISIKDIDTVICNLKCEGHQLEELEALLLNRNDFHELIRYLYKNTNHIMTKERLGSNSDEIRIFGVKIIESQYVPLGSIHKIFKDNAKQRIYPDSQFPLTIPESGAILFPPLCQNPTSEFPTITDEKPEEKKKKKQTRRVELG